MSFPLFTMRLTFSNNTVLSLPSLRRRPSPLVWFIILLQRSLSASLLSRSAREAAASCLLISSSCFRASATCCSRIYNCCLGRLLRLSADRSSPALSCSNFGEPSISSPCASSPPSTRACRAGCRDAGVDPESSCSPLDLSLSYAFLIFAVSMSFRRILSTSKIVSVWQLYVEI